MPNYAKRMIKLYDLAVSRYLDKNDFDVFDWLTPEETEEYEKLQVKMGEKDGE